MMKEENFIPCSVETIYDFFFTHIGFAEKTVCDLWRIEYKRALKSVKNVVNVCRYSYARCWAEKTINYYHKLRNNDVSFLSNIIVLPATDAMSAFIDMIKNNISPVIFNNKWEPCFLGNAPIKDSNKEHLFYWFNLSEMYNYVFHGKKDCPYEWCTENCPFRNKPCKKGMEKPYCIFQQFSRVYGLYKRQII